MLTWFTRGSDYAAHRPTYPAVVLDVLSEAAPDLSLAVDVGCGTGQLTALLASRFERVIGLDPSADQVRHAAPLPNVEYRVGAAENLDVPDSSASLITVAQAAHWFDLPAFYAEVRRIAAPGAALGLITYGVVHLDDDLAARFNVFYRDEIGPYWPPERRHVDNRYADLDFPFEEACAPALSIDRSWTLTDFIGYIETWSAVRRAREAGQSDPVGQLAADLAPTWGVGPRTVRWPVTIRLGRIGS